MSRVESLLNFKKNRENTKKKKMLSVRISEEKYKAFKMACDKKSLSMTTVISNYIDEVIDNI